MGFQVEDLLQTEALRIAPAEDAFWYTSGKIGPYYINTQYLFGGATTASGLLAFIDRSKDDRLLFPHNLRVRIERQKQEDVIYRRVVDELTQLVLVEAGEDFDFVSGGERRDWVFSLAVADALEKSHVLLYKDKSCVLADGIVADSVEWLSGRCGVHIADLVTEASSYTRAWIPALRDRGAEMVFAANVVDRDQGGLDTLGRVGVKTKALMCVDATLFETLYVRGLIDARQRTRLIEYYQDPHAAMRAFLLSHPEFVRQALDGDDDRNALRARALVEDDPYGLDLAFNN